MSGDNNRSAIFTEIWRKHIWPGQSRSGPGSGLARTAPLRAALEAFLEREQPHVFYDAPCGDFLWMQHVKLPAHTHFLAADIVIDTPPPCDVWLCRESLFHLTLTDAQAVVNHWRASTIPLFLATTSPTIAHNQDIATGAWRPLNLELAPFNLGPPSEMLPDGAPADPHKCIGVWRR